MDVAEGPSRSKSTLSNEAWSTETGTSKKEESDDLRAKGTPSIEMIHNESATSLYEDTESPCAVTYRSATLTFRCASSQVVKSLPARINANESEEKDEDEEEEDFLTRRQDLGTINFCSDLMDFEVGKHPNSLVLADLKPFELSCDDDEFVPSPCATAKNSRNGPQTPVSNELVRR